jgi:hypothetical protein
MASFIDCLPPDFKRFELRKRLNSLDVRLFRYSLHLSPDLGPMLTESEMTYALSYGVEFIKRLWSIINKKDIINLAAKIGNLEVIKFAREQRCNWGPETCRLAAQGGHLEVLKWIKEYGCTWYSDTCAYAALGAHLEVLKWARYNGCDWDSDTCSFAAEGGHLEVLKWVKENACDWDSRTCTFAANGGI